MSKRNNCSPWSYNVSSYNVSPTKRRRDGDNSDNDEDNAADDQVHHQRHHHHHTHHHHHHSQQNPSDPLHQQVDISRMNYTSPLPPLAVRFRQDPVRMPPRMRILLGDESIHVRAFADQQLAMNKIKQLMGTKVRRHECSPNCVQPLPVYDATRIKNPLLVPMGFNFFRLMLKGTAEPLCQICEYLYNRECDGFHVCYVTPCGKMLLSMGQVKEYLECTKYDEKVNIEMFTFVRDLPFGQVSVEAYEYITDISEGREAVPVSLVNTVDNVRWGPEFRYICDRRFNEEVKVDPEMLKEFRSCCSCTDNCASDNCECKKLTTEANCGMTGYEYRRLPASHNHGIFECNEGCPCSRSCPNRVIQHGIQCRLQLFRTTKKGWGLRTLQFIPKGQFICTYNGVIIDESMVHKDKNEKKDCYLADIDYIESAIENTSNVEGIWGRKDLYKEHGILYSVDGSQEANIGRCFNHSCDPNIFVQSVFVETHDMRFNHVAFFAQRDLRPFEELCWNYGYKLGTDRDRVLYCGCNSLNCLVRLI